MTPSWRWNGVLRGLLALDRRFGGPAGAKLALERRSREPADAKLALEWPVQVQPLRAPGPKFCIDMDVLPAGAAGRLSQADDGLDVWTSELWTARCNNTDIYSEVQLLWLLLRKLPPSPPRLLLSQLQLLKPLLQLTLLSGQV